MDLAASFSLPITIGVTGHRTVAPDQVAAIEKSVATVLENVRARAPHSRLLLLTSLAEGADRLVTSVAVEKFSAAYVAVLPRPAESYRQDFATEESKAEFDRLLAGAQHVVVKGGDPSPEKSADQALRERYANAGYFVSLHAHLLLALWDGKPARGSGGTAEIVATRLKGRYPGLNDAEPLQYAEGGATAQIVTTRVGESPPADAATVKWHYADVHRLRSEDGAAPFEQVLAAIDRTNRLAARSRRTPADWALPGPPSSVAALKSLADAYARHFQKLIHLTVKSLAVATLVAGLAAGLGDYMGSTAAALLTGVALVAGAVLWLLATFGKWQLLHVDFRGLAEAARIQVAWTAAGDTACVADHYHPVQASNVEWIRRALRTAWLLDHLETAAQPRRIDAKAALAWIDEQVDYFVGNKGVVASYRRQGRLFATLVIVCLGAGLFMLGTGKILGFLGGTWFDGAGLLRIAKIALAVTASLQAYQAFMAFKDLERSYAVAAHLFRIVNDQVRAAVQAGDDDRLALLTRAIGRAALVENVEWLMLKRQRRPKPPVG